jgi:type II secretory ATPase GspE/PulE/Tfp pilus assembly ATPase PilB-like protein
MLLYDPPKKIEYQDINILKKMRAANNNSCKRYTKQGARRRYAGLFVQQAYKLKASDIHMENQKENVRIRFRIDGVLHPVAYIDHEKYNTWALQ